MQIVDQAIDRSISHNEIVTLDPIDARQAGCSVQAIRDSLFAECEGDVETEYVHEYWGTDLDGNEWRVHIELPCED